MKDKWIEKYKKSTILANGEYVETLTAFNANIDTLYKFDQLQMDFTDITPELKEEITSLHGLKQSLLYCRENGLNREIDGSNLEEEFENGIQNIGGQAGIMANFLSNLNNSVIFYTPFLSEDLAELLNNDILYPTVEGDEFVLKNVKDCTNTDRTKNNLIFEFSGDKTGRMIVSDSLKGFGTYFRKGVEQHISKIDENLDRMLLSGFQNLRGNTESKLKKSSKQLELFETPIHLEYVDTDEELSSQILENIMPVVDSLGLDEFELRDLADESLSSEVHLGEAFNIAKDIIEEYQLSRIHIHTYNYHVTVVEDDYKINDEKIRDSMLFAEVCAIQMADKGRIPQKEDVQDFSMKDKYLKRLDHLEEFADFFDLEEFVESGIAEINGYRVIAIPTIIHEEPKRLVGMGDIISSAAFISELK